MLISKISGGVNNIPSDVKKHLIDENLFMNRKVLLREHKRHTAHCVMGYPSPVLDQYPISILAGGGVSQSCNGQRGTPVLLRGVPSPVLAAGLPQVLSPVLAGGTPVLGYTPPSWDWNIPLARTGVPPDQDWGTPCLERTWNQRPGKELGTGYPLGCGQTDT